MPSSLKFGFLGLGIMGSGIVKNLLNSGHSVVVWNRTPDKVSGENSISACSSCKCNPLRTLHWAMFNYHGDILVYDWLLPLYYHFDEGIKVNQLVVSLFISVRVRSDDGKIGAKIHCLFDCTFQMYFHCVFLLIAD